MCLMLSTLQEVEKVTLFVTFRGIPALIWREKSVTLRVRRLQKLLLV